MYWSHIHAELRSERKQRCETAYSCLRDRPNDSHQRCGAPWPHLMTLMLTWVAQQVFAHSAASASAGQKDAHLSSRAGVSGVRSGARCPPRRFPARNIYCRATQSSAAWLAILAPTCTDMYAANCSPWTHLVSTKNKTSSAPRTFSMLHSGGAFAFEVGPTHNGCNGRRRG